MLLTISMTSEVELAFACMIRGTKEIYRLACLLTVDQHNIAVKCHANFIESTTNGFNYPVVVIDIIDVIARAAFERIRSLVAIEIIVVGIAMQMVVVVTAVDDVVAAAAIDGIVATGAI